MDCIFCKIAQGQIPCQKIYEDEKVLAFYDLEPQAPVHFLMIPKKHIASLNDLTAEDEALIGYIFSKIKTLAKELGIAESGYRVVNNIGKEGGQSVFHIHFHVLGGRSLQWPPG